MHAADMVNSKLEALRKREAALKAAIAIEKVRQQKREEKEEARLHSIIGQALLQNAHQHPDFELMLKGILKSATTFGESEKKLLRAKGWL
jgi:hypothetical protein